MLDCKNDIYRVKANLENKEDNVRMAAKNLEEQHKIFTKRFDEFFEHVNKDRKRMEQKIEKLDETSINLTYSQDKLEAYSKG